MLVKSKGRRNSLNLLVVKWMDGWMDGCGTMIHNRTRERERERREVERKELRAMTCGTKKGEKKRKESTGKLRIMTLKAWRWSKKEREWKAFVTREKRERKREEEERWMIQWMKEYKESIDGLEELFLLHFLSPPPSVEKSQNRIKSGRERKRRK